MTFIIENSDGTFHRRVTETGNVLWGPRHFQPADTLTAEEKIMFGVNPLAEVAPPAFNAASERRIERDPQKINGVWTQVWEVVALSAAELAAKAAAADTQKQSQVDNIEKLQFYVAFNHENRIRILEGKTAITAAQFRTALKAQL